MATATNDTEFDVVEGEFTIDRCSSCATRIALRSPTTESPASAWLCRRCGSVYFARCQEKDGKPFSAGTRLVSYFEVMKAINVHIDGKASPVSAKDVQRLVQCLATKSFNGREARKQKRFPVAAPVTVVPLGADLRVAGQPARVMTINISGGGAALVHARRVVEPFLAIDFSASGVDLLPAVLQVTRVRALASAFEVAGRFLCRILH
ncbi:MAG TPA: PilZ domain-containing protein [Lacipirellula sp.]